MSTILQLGGFFMYYRLFNDVFEDNENKICIFQMGAFYVVINEQARYIEELFGFKKVCFAPGICKVGFPVDCLAKYMRKFQNLGISYVVLDACNMNIDADYTYKLKGFKKKCEFVDERFVFNKDNYKCNCNKCSFKKNELMKSLDNCYKQIARLNAKICSLELMKDTSVPCDISTDVETYEELMLWGNLDEE